jgi:hypothetical protein
MNPTYQLLSCYEPVPGCFVLSLFYSFVLVVYSSSLSLLIYFLLAGFHGGRFGLEISKHDITYMS